jgi:hypothetical protein
MPMQSELAGTAATPVEAGALRAERLAEEHAPFVYRSCAMAHRGQPRDGPRPGGPPAESLWAGLAIRARVEAAPSAELVALDRIRDARLLAAVRRRGTASCGRSRCGRRPPI